MSTPAVQSPVPAFQPGQSAPKKKGSPLRRYLVAGVLVWLPIVASLWVVGFLFCLADDTLVLLPLPAAYRPEGLMGLALPALGAVFVLVVLLLTGLLGTNLIGRRLLVWGEDLLHHIPIVGSVYGGVKSFAESVFSQSNSFRKVVMVEYPREGVWSLGFLTAETCRRSARKPVSRTPASISPRPSTPPVGTRHPAAPAGCGARYERRCRDEDDHYLRGSRPPGPRTQARAGEEARRLSLAPPRTCWRGSPGGGSGCGPSGRPVTSPALCGLTIADKS